MQLRNTGLKFSRGEFFTKFIRKDLLPNRHNKKVFQLARLISYNALEVSLSELHEIHQSGGKLEEFVNAHLIVQQKDLTVSKTDIKTLILSDINTIDILSNKQNGEEVSAVNELA